jgi:hypothetical protein
MPAVPYTFAHKTGNILLQELDDNFANVKAYANTAGSIVNANQSNITSVGTLVSLSVTGNIVGNIVNANTVSVAGNITTGNLISNGNLAVVSSINRNIYVSNSAPTSGDGNNGDIWFQTV